MSNTNFEMFSQLLQFALIFLPYTHGSELNNYDVLARDILQYVITDTKPSNQGLKKDEIAEAPIKRNNADFEKRSEGVDDVHGKCDINQKCPEGKYCDGMYCYKCSETGDHCSLNGVCCDGSECQFGVCTKDVKAGDPGTFCDLTKDCKGKNELCCIHEISISRHHPICKPLLEEHESCGPINLFHQDITANAHMEPVCGPCKPGLACKGVGILGRHSICLPEKET